MKQSKDLLISDELKEVFNGLDLDSVDFESRFNSLKFMGELKTLLDNNKVSYQECANMIGVSASYLSQLFYGNRKVNMDFMTKVAIAFGVQLQIKLCSNNHEVLVFERSERSSMKYWKNYSIVNGEDLSSYTVSPNEKKRQIA